MIWHIVGAGAAALTTFSFVPQIVKVIKTKSAKDVSLLTIAQLAAGVILWVVYGVYLKNAVIIIANFVTLITLAVLLFLCFHYDRLKDKS